MRLFWFFGRKCHLNPASDFLGFRRETNSYVGKPILTSDFVGFFFVVFFVRFCFFGHFMEFSKKGLGFLFVFVVFLFVGVRVVTILFFFIFFGFASLIGFGFEQ